MPKDPATAEIGVTEEIEVDSEAEEITKEDHLVTLATDPRDVSIARKKATSPGIALSVNFYIMQLDSLGNSIVTGEDTEMAAAATEEAGMTEITNEEIAIGAERIAAAEVEAEAKALPRREENTEEEALQVQAEVD